MATPLRVLMVEDNPNDATLLLRQLRHAGFEPECLRVDNEPDYTSHLADAFDVILSDYQLPQFSGLRALELLNQSGLDIPFVLVSGTIGEDVAVTAMKQGASDYLMKDRLARLGAAVEHAINQCRFRRQRRDSEEALRLFRTLVDQSDDIFEVLDPETGRLLDINAAGCAEHGYTRDEYLARRIFDIDPLLRPEDWPRRMADLRRQGTFSGESVHQRKDGTRFPVELRLKWVRLDRDYVVAAVRDISGRQEAERALRASEERFRQLAENIQEVFWMTDPLKNTMLYISPAYETIWGRTCASLYEHPDNWLQAMHPDDRDRVVAALGRQSSGGYHETYRILRPDGSVRWVTDRAFPIKDEDGAVYRVVGTAQDITEWRQLEEQFRQAQKLEAIGTLAGGIAHDFNNILGAIIGYVELTQSGLPSGALAQRYLEQVLKASHRASDLVRQILTFSRRDEPRRLVLNLQDVVGEPVKLLRATVPAMIEFDVSLPHDLPLVSANPTQIHQVVMNLCTNAAHAMKGAPGRLGVRLEKLAAGDARIAAVAGLEPGDYVGLTVSDTGCGMDPATLERIFEPFFTTKGPGEGTGLGLSVVHGIMRSHEGAVTVESRRGEGTTFRLYFPAVTSSEKAGAPVSDHAIPPGEGQRVLFVDDEPALAELGAAILNAFGYQAADFINPEEALGRMREDPTAFDLVITDMSMPGMTGLDLARRLSALREDLPIILTSGNVSQLAAESIRTAGIREVLPKPFTLESLGLAAHRALTRAKS